jgi:amino acid transporter
MPTTQQPSRPGPFAAGSPTYDVTQRPDVEKLHGKAIGLLGVLFLTLTGAAPMTAMLLNVPIVIGNGNGFGAPAAYVFATAVLVIFSVGYAAMARKVSAVGGFYSFISHGLGRELGMAMGLGSMIAYSVFEASLAGGFAYFACAKLATFGITVAWPVPALVMVAAIAILTYFDVKLSSAVLGFALIAEVVALLIFDAGVFGHAGSTVHVSISSLNPLLALHGFPVPSKGMAPGIAGIGLFFAFWCWVGFEMAPNYAEESRDPKRIVPLSLYISVTGLGIFFVLTTWAALSAFPSTADAINAGQNDTANFFFKPATQFVGAWLASVMSYLILTSCFACGMAFHNTAARYLYSLGRERILPASLGKTHSKYKAPYVASFVQTGISVVIVALFAIFCGTNDPSTQANGELYGLMALFGTILILVAQAIVSVAIIVYFRKHHPEEHHWWRTLVAPIISFLAQSYVIGLLVVNLDFLGGGFAFAKWLMPLAFAIVVLGIIGALYMKKKQPGKYDLIGRLIYEGVQIPDGTLNAAEHA